MRKQLTVEDGTNRKGSMTDKHENTQRKHTLLLSARSHKPTVSWGIIFYLSLFKNPISSSPVREVRLGFQVSVLDPVPLRRSFFFSSLKRTENARCFLSKTNKSRNVLDHIIPYIQARICQKIVFSVGILECFAQPLWAILLHYFSVRYWSG